MLQRDIFTIDDGHFSRFRFWTYKFIAGLVFCSLLINAVPASAQEEKEEREDVRLSNRKWTNLVYFPRVQQGEAPIPEEFPVWNYPKEYTFTGTKIDQHRLGNYKVDGEFIVRDGYLVREFGNSALLHLPPAEDFDLEGIIALKDKGGFLILVGWDIKSRSGYAIYQTQLVQGGPWFLIEFKDGQPVTKEDKQLVNRDVSGEGAFRLRVDDKKLSLQVAGAYLVRDVPLPNYQEGHVAIGTYSPAYGPRTIGIKSLRMRLR
ncbi:MAG: hypothetical protein HUJ26_12440 [Planctomycetaceae bacterium]|nr:hypothetical protein [Planctomycetaceae bacterium]